jgi:adiponectin receptor
MNIWTHLIRSAAFIGAGIGLYRFEISRKLKITARDNCAFDISITAAATYFGLSTTFHTPRSRSYNVNHRRGRFDIIVICLLALRGGSSATYYAARCDPVAQRVYWGLNASAALAAAAVLFASGGGGNKMRTLRGWCLRRTGYYHNAAHLSRYRKAETESGLYGNWGAMVSCRRTGVVVWSIHVCWKIT